MSLRYLVHSLHLTAISVPAKLEDGTVVIASMRGAIVELLPIDKIQPGRTVTLERIARTDEDLKAITDLFAEGNIVEDLGWKHVGADDAVVEQKQAEAAQRAVEAADGKAADAALAAKEQTP